MKRSLLASAIATLMAMPCLAQLDVTDTGSITRERWRDSVFRMDKSLVPTGFFMGLLHVWF